MLNSKFYANVKVKKEKSFVDLSPDFLILN